MSYSIQKLIFETKKIEVTEKEKVITKEVVIEKSPQKLSEPILSINWEDDLNNVTTSFDFTTFEKLKIGQPIALYEEESKQYIWKGIVARVDFKNDTNAYQYIGYDVGFYFAKNSITKQFDDSTLDDALRTICRKLGIQIKNIPENFKEYRITKNYRDWKCSDIVKDLLKIAQDKGLSKQTFIDCHNGAFNVFNYPYRDDLTGWLANTFSIKSTDSIHKYEISSSMCELKNRIIVVDNSGKVITKIPYEDKDCINEYGLLEYVYKLDNDQKNDYKKLGNQKLNELKNIKHTISLTMLGDYRMRRGVIIPLKDSKIKEYLELDGYYLITGSSHKIQGTNETVEVDLEFFTDDIKNIKNKNKDERNTNINP